MKRPIIVKNNQYINGFLFGFLSFTQGDLSGWTIQLGITRRHAHSYFGQRMKVKRVVPHPMYNQGIAHDNDVALFQVSFSITNNDNYIKQKISCV